MLLNYIDSLTVNVMYLNSKIYRFCINIKCCSFDDRRCKININLAAIEFMLSVYMYCITYWFCKIYYIIILRKKWYGLYVRKVTYKLYCLRL